MDDKMNMRITSAVLLLVFLVVLICASPSSADESDGWDDVTAVVALSGFVVADFGVTAVNGLLWLGHREQASTGWVGIGLGAATLLVSATIPAWGALDDEDKVGGTLAGLAIGAVTTTFGVVNKRHSERNREQQEAHPTSVTPSFCSDGDGKLATGVVVRIGF